MFEKYLVDLRGRGATFAEVVDAIVAIMSSALPLRERDRRAALVLGIATLDPVAAEQAAEKIAAKGSPLPQGLVRATQFRRASDAASMQKPPAPGEQTLPPALAASTPEGGGDDGATVLLLGSATDHHANVSLLDNKKIGVTRIDEPDQFEEVRREPFCGVVIAASWWHKIPPANHADELARILASSTIPWVRIDVSALNADAATALTEIVRRTYGADRSHAMLCHGSGCDITSADLESIRRVKEVLTSAGAVGFHPGEISVEEARLLRAAIVRHVRDTRGALPELEMMAVRFIHGGLSGARVAVATPDDRGMPLVVKLGALTLMREEAQRYSFVARWEGGSAAPHLHFHGDCALLLGALVDDGEGGAARTLGDEVQAVVYSDLSSPADTALLHRTQACVSRAIRRIAKLNMTTIVGGKPRDLGGLFTRSLAGRHISLGDTDVGRVLAKARAQVAKLDGCATVHGDLHLGNVLVRGDAPAFIDFGQAGAGHPAQDIAKLDSQIWFNAYRLTDDVSTLAALLRGSFSGEGVEQLVAKFPSLTAFASNRLCLESNSVARKEALDVVEEYGGGIADVAAMYIVFAAGEIMATPASVPIARAFISALADFV